MSHAEPCPVCKGSGVYDDHTCHGCHGQGWVTVLGTYPPTPILPLNDPDESDWFQGKPEDGRKG